MNHKKWCLFWLLGVTLGCSPAGELSSKEQAVQHVQRAQEYLKANGLAKATAEFNRLDSPFNITSPMNPKGDLYIWSVDSKGFQIIHGKNTKAQGKNLWDMRDVDGVFLIRELAEQCFSAAGKGWVKYRWPNPVSGDTVSKLGYVERVAGMDLCLGSGVYLQ